MLLTDWICQGCQAAFLHHEQELCQYLTLPISYFYGPFDYTLSKAMYRGGGFRIKGRPALTGCFLRFIYVFQPVTEMRYNVFKNQK